MSKGRDRTISRRPDGTWENKRHDARRASSLHQTQADAINAGREMLGNQGGGELIVKGRNGQFRSKGRPGKIFLMASSEVLKDNLLDAEGKTPNAMFIMNIMDYLNNREHIAIMRSKEQRFNPLVDTPAGVRTFVKSFNIVGLPVLVVLFGLLVWFRRHSRQKRIRIMFQS